MNRREFIQISASAAALASGGLLPLLAAEPKRPRRRRRDKFGPASGPRNIFTQPPAIEPITGYLPRFKPSGGGSMKGPFVAQYHLVQTSGAGATSRSRASGSLSVSFADAICTTKETRGGRPASVVRNRIRCGGDLNAARKWFLKSSVTGATDLGFAESGTWDGKQMIVKSSSWTQTRATSHPLIAQWALLGLLASGKFKTKPLQFDMLDNSTLRADQTLSYTGQVEVPVAKGKIKLDCYSQTGYGVLPIHYLVDDAGVVQLITQEAVNYALAKLG
jgi:hypothetical protein